MAAYKGTDGARLPQLLLDRRAQHRARPLQHGVRDRVPGRLRPSTRSARCAPSGYADGRAARRRPAGLERRPAAPDAAVPCGTPAAARAGTSTSTAATPLLWPRTTFTFRRLLSRFDAEAYDVARPDDRPAREGDRMKTLDDKVVVITGAGSGIGRALALDLAAPRLAARAVRRRRRRPRRDRRPGRERRRPRGALGPARRRRPHRLRDVRRRGRRPLRPGQRRRQQRRRRR